MALCRDRPEIPALFLIVICGQLAVYVKVIVEQSELVTAWKLGRGNLGKIPDVLFLLYIFHLLLLDFLPERNQGVNIR